VTEQDYIFTTDLARVRCILKLLRELNPIGVNPVLHSQADVGRIVSQWERALERRVKITE
jgi:hypothetical protein